jgi:WD40 repeat protein
MLCLHRVLPLYLALLLAGEPALCVQDKDFYSSAIVEDKDKGFLILKMHGSGVTSVAFSPDGKRIVSTSLDKTLKVWDAETGKEIRTLDEQTDGVWSVAYSPNGKRIVLGSMDKTIRIWELED